MFSTEFINKSYDKNKLFTKTYKLKEDYQIDRFTKKINQYKDSWGSVVKQNVYDLSRSAPPELKVISKVLDDELKKATGYDSSIQKHKTQIWKPSGMRPSDFATVNAVKFNIEVSHTNCINYVTIILTQSDDAEECVTEVPFTMIPPKPKLAIYDDEPVSLTPQTLERTKRHHAIESDE